MFLRGDLELYLFYPFESQTPTYIPVVVGSAVVVAGTKMALLQVNHTRLHIHVIMGSIYL